MRLTDADALLRRYDEEHEGPPGKARKLIEEAPAVWSTGTPKENGWYLVYAPTYEGGSSTSREHHAGVMFSKWSGKAWSIERCYYNRPGCVQAWMPIPQPPSPMKEGETNES